MNMLPDAPRAYADKLASEGTMDMDGITDGRLTVADRFAKI